MASVPPNLSAPGLSVRPKPNGTYRLVWRAPAPAIKAGYLPATFSLPFDITDPSQHASIVQACNVATQAALEWRTQKARSVLLDGTVKTLAKHYQTAKASPYMKVAPNTRRLYDYELRLIVSTIGAKRIDAISANDVQEWFNACIDDDAGTGARKAQGFIKRLRAIIGFGVVSEIASCDRLDRILEKMRFDTPPRRKSTLNFAMAKEIISKAHSSGRPSIALAQAIQFETGLRQTDVIGRWEADKSGTQRWLGGLVWQDIGPDFVLTIDTSKTGATVTHALASMPLVMAEIDRVPKEKRIGPLIVNETTGKPYQANRFSIAWRKIATEAGVPKEIWNRDSRAGALSEGDEAGADIGKLQRMAGHTSSKMTSRYVRGAAVVSSQEVANLRAKKRGNAP